MLGRNAYFIKEHVAFVKLTDAYDILDPGTQQILGVAKEEPPTWAKWLRLLVNKQLLPTVVNIYAEGNELPLFTIRKPFTLLRSRVNVFGSQGELYGYFKSKIFSIGGGFLVFDSADNQMADVKGDWKGWNFKFLANNGREIGTVSKKWAGIGKELFTSADNYMISLSDDACGNEVASALLLSAGLAIDIIYKEKK